MYRAHFAEQLSGRRLAFKSIRTNAASGSRNQHLSASPPFRLRLASPGLGSSQSW